MSLWITWEPDLLKEIPGKDRRELSALFRKTLRAALKEESVPVPCEVSLTLASKATIRELNRDHRGIDKVTDVLSFPLLSFEQTPRISAPVQPDLKKACESEENLDPDRKELMLGDIVICYEQALQQASEYGHSRERELAFLMAHSLLHLMGYDHMEPESEKVMFSRQEKILEMIGLTRS